MGGSYESNHRMHRNEKNLHIPKSLHRPRKEPATMNKKLTSSSGSDEEFNESVFEQAEKIDDILESHDEILDLHMKILKVNTRQNPLISNCFRTMQSSCQRRPKSTRLHRMPPWARTSTVTSWSWTISSIWRCIVTRNWAKWSRSSSLGLRKRSKFTRKSLGSTMVRSKQLWKNIMG